MTQRFWSRLAEHLAGGEAARVVLVAENTRHSPGTRGAKMFVRPNGLQEGTIGGGVMESRFTVPWSENMGPQTRTLSHRAGAQNGSGLICAGSQTIVAFDALPADAALFREFAEAIAQDALVALRVADGVPSVVASDRVSGADVWLEGDVYVEHAVRRKRIAIAGGGHCGLALSRTMKQLGYHVHIFDTRADLFTLQENVFTDERTVVDDFVELGARVAFRPLTHLAVMTANLPSDVRALLGALELDFAYVGVMGSEAKLARIRAELLGAGLPEEALHRLYAPIGLAMSSDTPEEIAVSVAAQILREREKLFSWTIPSSQRGSGEGKT